MGIPFGSKGQVEYDSVTEKATQEAKANREAKKQPATSEPPIPDKAPRTPAEKAKRVRDFATAGYLSVATAAWLGLDIDTWKTYLDTYLQESGNPSDRVERMLLEQMALTHQVVGTLFAKGAVEDAEAATIYHAAAARYMAECRRHALALASYRLQAAGARPKRPRDGSRAPRSRRMEKKKGCKVRCDQPGMKNRISEYFHENEVVAP